jgi:YegS/Rv2252/BmrU family lipid kinase
MNLLIIVNNAAAKAQRAWPVVESALKRADVKYDVYKTSAPGDATIKTRDALTSGTTTIAVVGGDGTLSEVAEGFFKLHNDVQLLPSAINPEASLAILPAGTGDDFARGLTGRRSPVEDWIATLIEHCRHDAPSKNMVDVLYGICDDYEKPFICINASTMGIGGQTARLVAAQGQFVRRFPGEIRFSFAALQALAVWRERRVQVSVDGEIVRDGAMNLAAVANALYAGGGMMLSPEASIDDGQLDVVTASGLTRRAVVRELSRIHTGGHIKNPSVQIFRGAVVRIQTFLMQDAMPIEADGNVRGMTPVEFRVMPRALRFVC